MRIPPPMRLAATLLLACAALAAPRAASADDLGDLARCISDSGATFYGAFWCPYCRRQLEAFGPHASQLPYVECSDRDRHTLSVCREAGVRSYPTWIFGDGSIRRGLTSPEELAHATGCDAPRS